MKHVRERSYKKKGRPEVSWTYKGKIWLLSHQTALVHQDDSSSRISVRLDMKYAWKQNFHFFWVQIVECNVSSKFIFSKVVCLLLKMAYQLIHRPSNIIRVCSQEHQSIWRIFNICSVLLGCLIIDWVVALFQHEIEGFQRLLLDFVGFRKPVANTVQIFKCLWSLLQRKLAQCRWYQIIKFWFPQ